MSARAGKSRSWRVLTAAETGAHHIAKGQQREDAHATLPDGSDKADQPAVTVAVADGHGHARHFRSERGSDLAVAIATRMGREYAKGLAQSGADRGHLDRTLRNEFGPTLIETWREAVIKDLESDPVRPDEYAASGLATDASVDDKIYGYGATLVMAVAAGPWLACIQIGDGDLFVIAPDGTVDRPLPVDPRLDGLRTTSLCQPDAVTSMRYALIDVTERNVGAVMLATDGYGNAQVRNDWEAAFGADIAALVAAHGPEWIAENLPVWVRQCASAEGSGDDVTVAMLFAAGTTWLAPAAASPSDETRPDLLGGPRNAARNAAVTVPVPAPPAPRTKTVDADATRHMTTTPSRTAATPAPAPRAAALPLPPPAPAPAGRSTTGRSTDRTVPIAYPASASPAVTNRRTTGSTGAHRVETPVPTPASGPSRRSQQLIVVLIVGVVAVLAVIAVMLFTSSGGPTAPAPSPTPTKILPSSGTDGDGRGGSSNGVGSPPPGGTTSGDNANARSTATPSSGTH